MFAYAFSFLEGTLTAISPCVLPALPLIVGSAAQEHRHAPLSVAAGLVLSFTLVGIFLALSAVMLGIDPSFVGRAAAVGLIPFGFVLVVPVLQDKFQNLLSPLTRLANNKLSTGRFKGLSGQFGLGCLLGAVWSPCVGPSLGAAFSLASRGQDIGQATLMMFLFGVGVGAALPLVLIAYGARHLFVSYRGNFLRIGQMAKPAMGIVVIFLGISILLGWDKAAEGKLLNILPTAWVDLISRY